MLREIYDSGLLNTTFLAALVAVGVLLFPRTKPIPRALKLAGLCILFFGTSLCMFAGIYRAYAIPRDVLQDIIAAQEFAAGRPMHPKNMNELMRISVHAEPPRKSLFWWKPEIAEKEAELREATYKEHWVQAHPPPLTLATVPMVQVGGVLGSQLIYIVLGLLALAVCCKLLLWRYGAGLDAYARWAFILGLVGCSAVVASIRGQQLSLILTAMLLGGWFFLRKRRDYAAGILIGAAICLKFVPGVLLLPLAIRHRTAFAVAVATAGTIALLTVGIVPWSDLMDYRATSSEVMQEYSAYGTNLSAFSVFTRWAISLGLPLSYPKAYWVGMIGVVGLLWAYYLFRNPERESTRGDLIDVEFSLAFSLIPLLSPVSWDHYLVFLMLPLGFLGREVLRNQDLAQRILFSGILIMCVTPDSTFIWLVDKLGDRGQLVSVWLVQPSRTFAVIAIAGWLGLIFRARTSQGFAFTPTEAQNSGQFSNLLRV